MQRSAQAVVRAQRAGLVPRHPPDLVHLREVGRDHRVLGRRHEVAQVEVLVGGLAPVHRDVVHVHVERSRRGGVKEETADTALLEGLAERHLLAGRLPGLAVAPRLQPAVELAVMQQQHA